MCFNGKKIESYVGHEGLIYLENIPQGTFNGRITLGGCPRIDFCCGWLQIPWAALDLAKSPSA